MSKSGLFAHFRSKEEVQIGLLQYMAEFATARVVAPAMKVQEGLPRVKALVANCSVGRGAQVYPVGARWLP
jgi:hypothetical protein